MKAVWYGVTKLSPFMNKQLNLFEQVLQNFPGHPPEQVFDDFLSIAICLLAADSPQQTTVPFNFEQYYSEVSKPYSRQKQKIFPVLLHVLIEEVQRRVKISEEPDVLGEYYQNHCAPEGEPPLLPYDVLLVIAFVLSERGTNLKSPDFLVRDCQSGGLLSALYSAFKDGHTYYGLEHNPVYAKMAAINLFLRGVSDAEVLYADTPDGFSVSYRITGSPRSLMIITRPEDSELWNALNAEESNLNIVSLSQTPLKPQ